MNKELLQYLCCPKCKSELKKIGDWLICKYCNMRYPIKMGIPILTNLATLPEHLQKQIEYFEKETEGDLDYEINEWQKSYIRKLDENFQFSSEDILIDVGTGSGYVAIEMARRGLEVIACDLTFKKLNLIRTFIKRENLGNKLFLVCCSAEDLPFKNDIAKYLVSNAVLEHLPQEKKAVSEISRVTFSNEAELMITVPLKLKYISFFFRLPNYIHDRKIGHLRRYDEERLRSIFKKHRYETKKIYYSGHFEKELIVSLGILGVHKQSWNKWCEIRDQKKESRKKGANNICIIFKRQNGR